MKKLLLLTLLLTIATHHLQSQVVQELNTRSAVKTWVVKDALSIPQVATLPASPALLNYHPSASKGSPVWCTCLTDTSRIGFNVWDGTAWQTLKPIGATLPPVPAGSFLDSTGQYQGRPLISAPGQRISSSPFFLYDTANRKLVINNTNVSIGGPQYKLYVNGKTYNAGLTLGNMTNYIGAPQDDTKYPLAWDTNGDVVTFLQWPKVTSFAKNATRDSIILTFSNGSRFAVLDSVGAGGGSGVTTVGTFSGTGNANGASISGSTITMHPATATEPGMVSTGAQTWAGSKTFNDNLSIAANRLIDWGNGGTGAKMYTWNNGSAQRQGISHAGGASPMTFFSNNGYEWRSGGDPSGTVIATLSNTGLFNPTQYGFIDLGLGAGAKLYTLNAGVAQRQGFGTTSSQMHYFSNGSHRFYLGGDYSTSATVQMEITTSGVNIRELSNQQKILPLNNGSKLTWWDVSAGNRAGVGWNNDVTPRFTQFFGPSNSAFIFSGNGDYTATGMAQWMNVSASGVHIGAVTGNTVPASSAVIEATSTTKGFLPPRMTQTQRNAISSPANGLIIFCTDCTATDGSTGVSQTYSSSSWRNHY